MRGEPAGEPTGRAGTRERRARRRRCAASYCSARRSSRRVSSATWACVAPFCGPYTRAASGNGVVDVARDGDRDRPSDHPSASTAASPPSVVALPPTPTMTRRAPSRTRGRDQLAGAAASTRAAGRCARRPGASPLACAISTTAVPPGSIAHSASTGSPSGPVTRRVPARAAERREQRVEGALAAVGERQLAHVVEARAPQPAAIAAAASARARACRGTCRGTRARCDRRGSASSLD